MSVFLVLLLFAVQVALNLYATSAVTAVAFDAARRVAVSDGDTASVARAEAHAREVLDDFEARGGILALHWDLSRDDVVRLDVVASRPSLLARVPVPFQRIERTVVVRWERRR